MALPVTVVAGHNAAIMALAEVKASDLIRTVNLIKDLCQYAIGETQFTPTPVYRLIQLQSSLFRHKDHITTNNLAAADVRQVLVDHYGYASLAAVAADIQAASAAFNNLTAELENVIAVARAAGQIVDTDPTTGELQEALASVADTANLRATATAVLATME